MKSLVTDIRVLRGRRKAPSSTVLELVVNESDTCIIPDKRLFGKSKWNRPLVGTPILVYTESEPEILEAERFIRQMQTKNPALAELISALDLIPAGCNEAKLFTQYRDTADKLLKPSMMYTKEEIISLLLTRTKDRTRAENGFDLMLQAKGIQPTLNPDLFYLGSSTPF
ncbi:hypothetical protein GCM10028803_46180 [Larkinella knui]|uniref:Uncharacterized protein n=1 Tax=Larkinella knui TaxID=2025310 RepID=A0A3P1CQ67_9BACT|nr:hypothetical protein [Larkinella knui]RRB15216.1 hypothetical protein EHT87_11780 [Larkinella knui]